MATSTENGASGHGIPWRILGWGTAALPLSLPYFANAPWTLSDFVFMGVLFGLVGLAVEFLFRKSGSLTYRLGAAGAIVTAFMTIWVNAAVGMIGDGPYKPPIWRGAAGGVRGCGPGAVRAGRMGAGDGRRGGRARHTQRDRPVDRSARRSSEHDLRGAVVARGRFFRRAARGPAMAGGSPRA